MTYTLYAEKEDGNKKQVGEATEDLAYLQILKKELRECLERFGWEDRTLLIYNEAGKVVG